MKHVYLFYYHNWVIYVIEVILCDLRPEGEERIDYVNTKIEHDWLKMNVEKTKVMRISKQPSPVTIMIDQKQLENVERFK